MTFKPLELGTTSNEVRQLHEILMELGYRIPKVTEEYDVYTRSAVKAFQNDSGLRVTGAVDEKTWDYVMKATVQTEKTKDDEPIRSESEAVQQSTEIEVKIKNETAEQDIVMEADETVSQSSDSQAHVPEMPVIPQYTGASLPDVPKVKWDLLQNMDEDDKADIGQPWSWSGDQDKQMNSEVSESAGGKEPMEHSEMKTEKSSEWELNSKTYESDMIDRKIRLMPVDFDPDSIQGERNQVVRSNNTEKSIMEKETEKEALEYETESVGTTTAQETNIEKVLEKSADETVHDNKAAHTTPAINYIPAIRCDDEGCVGFAMIKKSKKENKLQNNSDNYTRRIDPAAPWEHTSYIIPSTARRYYNRTVEEELLKPAEVQEEKKASIEAEAEDQKTDKKPKWSGEELRPIQWGSRNRTVNLLQRRLTELGYFKGDINGYFGFETRMAVIDFQLDRDIKADGIVDNETWKALYEVMSEGRKAWPELKAGDSGQDVVTLQKYLKEMVYYSGIADGYFGSMTHEAAVKFKLENGMNGDGVIDGATWDAMEKKLMSMSAMSAAE